MTDPSTRAHQQQKAQSAEQRRILTSSAAGASVRSAPQSVPVERPLRPLTGRSEPLKNLSSGVKRDEAADVVSIHSPGNSPPEWVLGRVAQRRPTKVLRFDPVCGGGFGSRIGTWGPKADTA